MDCESVGVIGRPCDLISGIFIPVVDLPGWLEEVARIFRVYHLVAGLQTALGIGGDTAPRTRRGRAHRLGARRNRLRGEAVPLGAARRRLTRQTCRMARTAMAKPASASQWAPAEPSA
jgi:hypothetical protein